MEFVANARDIEQRKKNGQYYKERRTRKSSFSKTKGTPQNTKARTGNRRDFRDRPAKIQDKDQEGRVGTTNTNPHKTYNEAKHQTRYQQPRNLGQFHNKSFEKKPNEKMKELAPRTGKHKYQWAKEPFKADGKKVPHNNQRKPYKGKAHMRAVRSDDGSDNDADGSLEETEEPEREVETSEEETDKDLEDHIKIEVPEYYEEDDSKHSQTTKQKSTRCSRQRWYSL